MRSRDRSARPIAVTFEVPDSAWPAYLELQVPEDAVPLVERAVGRCGPAAQIVAPHSGIPALVLAPPVGFEPVLSMTLRSSKALGKILAAFLEGGGVLWRESLQVVFRRPIPHWAVVGLAALDRPNHARRQARDGS